MVVGQELDRDIGDSEQRAGGSAEEQALRRARDAVVARHRGDRGAGEKDAALDRDQRRGGVVRRLAVRPRRQPDDREPCRRDDHADPLAAAEPEAEEALGEDGEKHQPTREDGLHDRQRGEGEGGDVEHPGGHRHPPTDREPLRAEEAGRASQRVPDLHIGREDRATVLEQKRDACGGGADQGEGEPDDHVFGQASTGAKARARIPFTK